MERRILADRARKTVVVAVLLLSPRTGASQSVELAVGAAVPLATESWSRDAAVGLTVGARIAHRLGQSTGLLSIDWSRFSNRRYDRFDRFRLTAGRQVAWQITDTLISARFGLGLDGVSCATDHVGSPNSWDTEPGHGRRHSYWNTGVAMDVALSVLHIQGPIRWGLELGMPLGFHGTKTSGGDVVGSPALSRMTLDADLLVVVRTAL